MLNFNLPTCRIEKLLTLELGNIWEFECHINAYNIGLNARNICWYSLVKVLFQISDIWNLYMRSLVNI
jgi:hypothetical protein